MTVWDKIGWMEGRLSVKGLTGAHTLRIFSQPPRSDSPASISAACPSALLMLLQNSLQHARIADRALAMVCSVEVHHLHAMDSNLSQQEMRSAISVRSCEKGEALLQGARTPSRRLAL